VADGITTSYGSTTPLARQVREGGSVAEVDVPELGGEHRECNRADGDENAGTLSTRRNVLDRAVAGCVHLEGGWHAEQPPIAGAADYSVRA
jgi:hypothetical protein